MLGFMVLLWYQAGVEPARALRLTHPLRAALVTAFVGCLSGEYLYGGTVLLSLFVVDASVGSLPAEATRLVKNGAFVARHARAPQTWPGRRPASGAPYSG